MFTRYILLFILLQVAVFPHVLYGAPEATIGSAPAWLLPRDPDFTKKADKRHISSGHYYLLHDIQVNVAEQTNYIHYVVVITNKTGVQNNSEINISFPGAYQRLIFHDLSITRGTQRINKLSQSAIKVVNEEPFMSEYQLHDYTRAFIIMDDVREGDRIELAYSLKGFNPVLGGKYNTFVNMLAQNPVVNNYNSILMPAGRTLNYKCHSNAPTPQVKNEGGYTVYDWPVMELKPETFEGNTPGWYLEYKYVDVSEFNNWNEVALWAHTLIKDIPMQLPGELERLAGEWEKKAGTSKIEFAQSALRFVQNDIRYLGIEIGEYTHRPHSPAETFNRRYGDCKDKSLLLAAILRSRGISAELVLVNTDMKRHVADWLPGKNFDHVIVKMTLDGHTKYVDPTASNQFGPLLSTYLPDYGKGLVVSASSTGLEDIPFDNEGSVVVDETFDLTGDSTITLDVKTVYFNRDANAIRSTLRYSSLSELEESYEDYYSEMYGDAEMISELRYEDDTVNNFVTVWENYTLKDAWTREGDEKMLYLKSSMIYERLTAPVKTAMNKPLYQPYPVNITHNIIIKQDEEISLADDDIAILEDDYLFRFGVTKHGDMLTLKYEYRTFNDHIPVEKVAGYAEDYEEITKAASYGISINDKALNELRAAKSGGIIGKVNIALLLLAAACAGLAHMILRRQNRRKTYWESTVNNDAGLTGWLAFFAFVVSFRPLLYLYVVFKDGYLAKETWIQYSAFDTFVPQVYLVVETIVMAVFCTLAFWVAYWTFKKRDILPRMFMILAVSELAYNLLLFVIGVVFNERIQPYYPGFTLHMGKATFRSLVFILVWGLTLYRTDKAKRVFSRPYGEQPADDDAVDTYDDMPENTDTTGDAPAYNTAG